MENLYPHAVKRIYKELQEVINDSIEGIRVLVNDQDVTDVQADIDGPIGTPYEGGEFRVRLIISEKYPEEPPKGYFHTKVFHPNVAPATGEICVNTLKRDWKSNLGLRHIFLVIRCLLLDPNPESALNEEAGRLLLEDYDEYVSQARLFTSVHACNRVHDLAVGSQLNNDCRANSNKTTSGESDSISILRDTNGPSPKKPMGNNKPAQRHISATKKALKRL